MHNNEIKINDTVVTIAYKDKKSGYNVAEGYKGIVDQITDTEYFIKFENKDSLYITKEAVRKTEPIMKSSALIEVLDTDSQEKVTNKVLSNDIVIRAINTSTVDIIKNQYNNVTGRIPMSLYKALEEEYLEACREQNKEEISDDFESFNKFFDKASVLFSKIADDVSTKLQDIEIDQDYLRELEEYTSEFTSKVNSDYTIAKLKAMLKESEELGVSTKGYRKKVLAKIQAIQKMQG